MHSWWQKLKPKAGHEENSHGANLVDPYKEGIRLYESGLYADAYRCLAEALRKEENSQRWNDWAAVQLALKNLAEAERGFRRAIDLDPNYSQAQANLGALLAQQGRKAEAIPILEKALAGVDQGQKAAVEKFLALCRQAGAPASNVSPGALHQIVETLSQQQATLNAISLQVATLSDALNHLLRQPAAPAAAPPAPEVSATDFPAISPAKVLAVPNSFMVLTAADPEFGLTELGLIASLLKSAKAERIFDLSEPAGQSTLHLAANAGSDAQVYTLSNREPDAPFEPPYDRTRYQSRIVELSRNRAESEDSQLHGTFDFVLIDAGRERAEVLADSRLALKLLQKGGGMIVWRNAGKPGDSTSTCLRDLSLLEARLGGMQRVEGTGLVFVGFGANAGSDAVTAKPVRIRRGRSSVPGRNRITGRPRSRPVTFATALAEAGGARIQPIPGAVNA